jgi:hypothetical protein
MFQINNYNKIGDLLEINKLSTETGWASLNFHHLPSMIPLLTDKAHPLNGYDGQGCDPEKDAKLFMRPSQCANVAVFGKVTHLKRFWLLTLAAASFCSRI